MKKLFLLPLLFLMSGCVDHAQVDCKYQMFVSGLTFCSEVPVEGQVEFIENVVQFIEEEVQVHYPDITDTQQAYEDAGVVVHIIGEGTLATGCTSIDNNVYRCDNHAAGVAVEHNRAIYIKGYSGSDWCIGFSALGHELLHIIEYTYFGEALEDHSRPHFFVDYLDPVEVTQSKIEYKADRRAVEMCIDARENP